MTAMAASTEHRLRALIRDKSLLRQGGFQLASGGSSNYFFDMKKTMFDPEGAALLADLLFERVKGEKVDYIGGLETGALPIAAGVSRRTSPEKTTTGFFWRQHKTRPSTPPPHTSHLQPAPPRSP